MSQDVSLVGKKDDAVNTVVFDGRGKVSLYTDGRIEAVCFSDAHKVPGVPQCKIRRASVGGDDNPAQGRPLGLLAAWVLKCGDFVSRDCHCDRFTPFAFSQEERKRARDYALALPGGVAIAGAERPQRPGEEIEPEGWA